MKELIRPVWAEINLDSLAYNMKNIKKLANGREVIGVVKADAYGHGSVEVSKVLLENGASRLAVAIITEAVELRKNNIKAPIMILGYTPLEFGETLVNNDIEQTVYDLEYAKSLSDIAINMGKKAKIHIALDTGMGRIGFLPNEDSLNKVLEIASLKGIEIVGIFTHFSTADEENKEYTYEQFSKIKNFNNMLLEKGLDIPLKHASNSGAIIDLPETYLDCVRAGIILYGYYPSDEVKKEKLPLKTVLTLKTKIVHVKKLDKDMYISYGRTFKTERDSIIATIPIGYADGYSRLLSGKAKVIVNGKFAKVVGRICMDQCMIDVTDIEDVKVGDEVILLGEENNLKFNADDMAKIIGTINYDVLCMIKHRIPRVYIKDNKIFKTINYI
ncbi:alanine racemase [Clostridium moniliforme]|uniref:Alanine racemase n=1 Tax=Clostridium moniliforme TaxID=39489 RepID=A0ABS4EXH4_9CLOT|nr:alanine racemase [Clostridium moniliforme]MBP1888688.1 alanine racemase [Clostridium moniliforme]